MANLGPTFMKTVSRKSGQEKNQNAPFLQEQSTSKDQVQTVVIESPRNESAFPLTPKKTVTGIATSNTSKSPASKVASNQQSGKLPRPIVVATQPILFPKLIAQEQKVLHVELHCEHFLSFVLV